MKELFTNYYHFERVWKNNVINRYTLARKLKEYPAFDRALKKLCHFKPILYQPDHVLVYNNSKKVDEPLTVIVPFQNDYRIGMAKQGADTIVFRTTHDYDNVEMFIIERKQVSLLELFRYQQTGELKTEMARIREKALLKSIQ